MIVGPPKHVLHLVWSAYVLSTAIRTALKVARTVQIQGDRRPVLWRIFISFLNPVFISEGVPKPNMRLKIPPIDN